MYQAKFRTAFQIAQKKKGRKKKDDEERYKLFVATKLLKENRYSAVLIKKGAVKIRLKAQNK